MTFIWFWLTWAPCILLSNLTVTPTYLCRISWHSSLVTSTHLEHLLYSVILITEEHGKLPRKLNTPCQTALTYSPLTQTLSAEWDTSAPATPHNIVSDWRTYYFFPVSHRCEFLTSFFYKTNPGGLVRLSPILVCLLHSERKLNEGNVGNYQAQIFRVSCVTAMKERPKSVNKSKLNFNLLL